MCLKRVERQAVGFGVDAAGENGERGELAGVAQRRDAGRVAARTPAVEQAVTAADQRELEFLRCTVELGGELDDQLGGAWDLFELLVAVFCGGFEVAAKVQIGDEEAADWRFLH